MTTEKAPPIFTKLYKGKIEVKLFPDSHIYMVDGKRVTGVTTYIGIKDKSRALTIWATELFRDFLLGLDKIKPEDIYRGCGLHMEKKQEAADIGEKIHSWIEQYIKSSLDKSVPMPEMPEEQSTLIGVTAFLEWSNSHKVKFVSSERMVYSKKHEYVGTLDIEAMIGKKRYLVDIKSSNGLYNTVNLQTAAYVKADEEESGKKYDGRWAIRVAKESQKEYDARMKRKNMAAVASGRNSKEYGPYVAFEAKELLTDIDDDFKAFLAAKTLYEWDKETDYYRNK